MPAIVDAASWAARIRAGDVRALSRAITAIENRDPAARELLATLFPSTGAAYLIGCTGAPGTGKSTLVDRLAAQYRNAGDQVGVIAVDPTSPYTGGAILGDRIRMQSHYGDSGVFIRSMATRGRLGGLSAATADAALLLDAAGKRVVLIETVGVGQDEVDVVRLADCTIVLLVPGLGDDIQTMKAGVMEVADIFVVNKSDHDGAERLEQQICAMLDLAPKQDAWRPLIVRTVASEGRGIDELVAAIARFRAYADRSSARASRNIDHWKRRLVAMLEIEVTERVLAGPLGAARLESLAREVADRRTDPYAAIRELASRAGV
ncbi:MAG: methylmalonyl Co-A mutase-associated GTPase MeaB [Candidatus Acidiferrales bacterium]